MCGLRIGVVWGVAEAGGSAETGGLARQDLEVCKNNFLLLILPSLLEGQAGLRLFCLSTGETETWRGQMKYLHHDSK